MQQFAAPGSDLGISSNRWDRRGVDGSVRGMLPG